MKCTSVISLGGKDLEKAGRFVTVRRGATSNRFELRRITMKRMRTIITNSIKNCKRGEENFRKKKKVRGGERE